MTLVVFDLDGTLIDSRLDLAESVNELLAAYGAAPRPVDEVAMMVGEGARVLVRRAIEAAGLAADADADVDIDEDEALARFLDVYDRRLLIHTRPYDGIDAVVRDAATRGPLAVLTNKPQAPTHRLLEAFDLARYFRRVIGGDSGAPRKPNPAGLQALMTEVGASPAETMLVGDSMIDVETARRAGARMCVALYGFGHARGEMVLDGTELTARTPTDVGEVVGRFFRPGV